MPKLLEEKEITVGTLYKMKKTDFAQYIDATKTEKGVTVNEVGSIANLFKLLVATEKLGYVIIANYKDTTEEVIALLKISLSGRIILQEIIPLNLVKLKQTLIYDKTTISEEEIEEAQMFVDKFIPTATEKNLKVHDYRELMVTGAKTTVEEEPQKVQSLKEIMAMVK